MTALLRWIDRANGIAAGIACVLLMLLMGAMVWEVAMRYLLNAPTAWAFEISYMLMGAGFLLAVGYALREGTHVRMDLFHARFPPRLQGTVDALLYGVLILPLTVWLAWRLGHYAFESWLSGEVSGKSAWNPQVWPFRAAIALGMGLFALQVLAEFLRALVRAFGREDGRGETGSGRP